MTPDREKIPDHYRHSGLDAFMEFYAIGIWLFRLLPIPLFLVFMLTPGGDSWWELLLLSLGGPALCYGVFMVQMNYLAHKMLVQRLRNERSFRDSEQLQKFRERFLRHRLLHRMFCALSRMSFAEMEAELDSRYPPATQKEG